MAADDTDFTVTSAYPTYVVVGALSSFTVPRAGDYEISFGSNYYNSVAGQYLYTTLFVSAVATSWTTYTYSSVAGSWQGGTTRIVRQNAIAASAVVDLRHCVGAGTGHVVQRHIVIRPVRVA